MFAGPGKDRRPPDPLHQGAPRPAAATPVENPCRSCKLNTCSAPQLAPAVDLNRLAARTHGFTGADLVGVRCLQLQSSYGEPLLQL